MVRVAIVEDDPGYQTTLTGYLRRYEGETRDRFQVRVYQDGVEVVRDYQGQYDIILLDVKMAGLDGFSAAERIRERDRTVILIFITNLAQYAIKGYKVDALNYLLKPVSYFAFSQEMKRALTRLARNQKRSVVVPVERGLRKLDNDDILYVETGSHRVLIHTTEGVLGVNLPLRDMAARLGEDRRFFRCNSCYLVNMARVTGVEGRYAFLGANRVQISRPRRKAFLAALTDYLGAAL